MKNKDIIAIFNALSKLAELESSTPLKLGAKTRLALVHNISKCREHSAFIDETKRQVFNEIGKGQTSIDPKSPEGVEILGQLDILMLADSTIELRKVTEDDLNLEANSIPLNVLADLMPIIGS